MPLEILGVASAFTGPPVNSLDLSLVLDFLLSLLRLLSSLHFRQTWLVETHKRMHNFEVEKGMKSWTKENKWNQHEGEQSRFFPNDVSNASMLKLTCSINFCKIKNIEIPINFYKIKNQEYPRKISLFYSFIWTKSCHLLADFPRKFWVTKG